MMKKMKAKYIFILLLLAGNSCEVDYKVGDLQMNEPECIILNCILNPEKQIEMQLHKLQIEGKRYTYTGLEGAKIILKEGQTVLYDDICRDSILNMACFPKENMNYSVEVSFGNLKTVKATTKIPPAIHCESSMRTCDCYFDSYLIGLHAFEIPQTDSISMFVTTHAIYEKDEIVEEAQYAEMYTKNAFVDKTNCIAGMPLQHEEVGSIYHDDFLRVKNKNLPHLDDLVYSPTYADTYYLQNSYVIDTTIFFGDIVFIHSDPRHFQTKIKVKIITASIEYDQFSKSYYEQKNESIFNRDLSSIFQPRKVYSNIENGLGIFAGMNETHHFFDLPKNDD